MIKAEASRRNNTPITSSFSSGQSMIVGLGLGFYYQGLSTPQLVGFGLRNTITAAAQQWIEILRGGGKKVHFRTYSNVDHTPPLCSPGPRGKRGRR